MGNYHIEASWVLGYVISYFMQHVVLSLVLSSWPPLFKSPNYVVNLISDKQCLSKIKKGYWLVVSILAVIASLFFVLIMKKFDVYSDIDNLVFGFFIASFATVHLILSALFLKIKADSLKKEVTLIIFSVLLSFGLYIIIVLGFFYALSLGR